MSDDSDTARTSSGEARTSETADRPRLRTFLVVVDESEEMSAALLYASARARATGGVVALLKVIEPPEFAHFAAIGKRMADENREAAEQTLQRFAAETVKMAGRPPVLYVREGKAEDAVRDLLETEGGHFHPGASRRHRVGGARSACLGADGENGRACPRAGDSGARKPDARRDPGAWPDLGPRPGGMACLDRRRRTDHLFSKCQCQTFDVRRVASTPYPEGCRRCSSRQSRRRIQRR